MRCTPMLSPDGACLHIHTRIFRPGKVAAMLYETPHGSVYTIPPSWYAEDGVAFKHLLNVSWQEAVIALRAWTA